MTIKETGLFFTSRGEEAIRLEGVFHHPGGKHLPAAVICHPHSLYGGNMDVSVVVSIARTLAERGVIAFRFNFRGAGRSEGAYGNGVAELDDVAGSVDFLLREKGMRILRGTDHFLIGREKEVAKAVADFIWPEKLTGKRCWCIMGIEHQY